MISLIARGTKAKRKEGKDKQCSSDFNESCWMICISKRVAKDSEWKDCITSMIVSFVRIVEQIYFLWKSQQWFGQYNTMDIDFVSTTGKTELGTIKSVIIILINLDIGDLSFLFKTWAC